MKTLKGVANSAASTASKAGTSVAKTASKAASSTTKVVSKATSKGYGSIKTAVVNTNPRKLNTQGIVLIVLGVLVLVGLGVGIYFLTRECDMYCEAIKSIKDDFNNRVAVGGSDSDSSLLESIITKLFPKTGDVNITENELTNLTTETGAGINLSNMEEYKSAIKNAFNQTLCGSAKTSINSSPTRKQFATLYLKTLNTNPILLRLLLLYIVVEVWKNPIKISRGLFIHTTPTGKGRADVNLDTFKNGTVNVLSLKEWLTKTVYNDMTSNFSFKSIFINGLNSTTDGKETLKVCLK
tara:strand:+ start:6258 stop:7145 length:888 start_codon:yes stop_codon:yes gene_type:complete